MTLPVCVIRGAEPGPTVWISAAIHGDEINGTQIIRRVLALLDPHEMRGTVIAVPIVDVYGFNSATRYLPDRRDLNRSFPGSSHGSLAAQVAHMFTTQIVKLSDFGLDLHTGSDGRTNLPQVRGDTRDTTFMALAEAFSPPVILHSDTIEGSLRAYCGDKSIPYLIYEAGQAGRFDPDAISVGVDGCMRVLSSRAIINDDVPNARVSPSIVKSGNWLRAPSSGIFVPKVSIGDRVNADQTVGEVGDIFGDHITPIASPRRGIVIGLALDPLVENGDAIVHLAQHR